MRNLPLRLVLAYAAVAAAPAGAASSPSPAPPPLALPIPATSAAPAKTPPAVPSPLPLSGPQVGARAPHFTLRTLGGNTVTLDTYKGKTLVINAWATWCPPCREEMPDYIAAAPKLSKVGVAILGVDTTEPQPVLRAYAVSKAVPYALAVATSDAFQAAYDVQYFPTTFIIDPQGVLRARIVSVVTGPQLTSFVQAAKGGRNVVIVSALQRQIDAKLSAPSLALRDGPAAVEADAKKAAAAIAAAETMLDDADASKGETVDFLRTRAQEAALRDRAIAALVDVGSSVADRTLLARLRAQTATDREQWREAAQAYRAVLALAPNDTEALEGLSRASWQLHDYDAAIDAETKLVAVDPKNVDALVSVARYLAKAGKKNEATATFARAIATAQQQLAAEPHKALALRTVAYAHLYAGRTAATNGDRSAARAEFDNVLRLAARLPQNDARRDMYLEEAQEAIVALGLAAPSGLSVSLAPWTGADLPGSIPSTFKYRLAVAGGAGRNVSLVASGVPKHWIASFCSDNACAPFRTNFALPASGVKVVEFALVPPGAHASAPKVRVMGRDGKNEATAAT